VRRITLMGGIRMWPDPLDFGPDAWALLVSEPLGSAVDRRASLVSDAPVSAPDARAYFLFCGKKKVAKEKATPGSAPGCARSLALLDVPGGWLNSPLRGSDNASRLPPARLRCSAPLRGTPKTDRAQKFAVNCSFLGKTTGLQNIAVDRPKPQKTNPNQTRTVDKSKTLKNSFGAPGPLGGAEQRRVGGGCRLALSEARRAEFSETPAGPSSAGNPRSGRRPRVAFFFGYFLLGDTRRKYARASGAEHSALEKTNAHPKNHTQTQNHEHLP